MNLIEAIWRQGQFFKYVGSILLNYKLNAIRKTCYFLKSYLLMKNISVLWMIRPSSHIMKEVAIQKSYYYSFEAKQISCEKQTTQNENTQGEILFFQTI